MYTKCKILNNFLIPNTMWMVLYALAQSVYSHGISAWRGAKRSKYFYSNN